MKRTLAILAAALALAGCATTPPAPESKPKLVVFLVVDGFPERQLLDYRNQYGPDGFRRFLERGAWFADASYGYSFTVTGSGHATMLTGAYPHKTQIIGNEWKDNKTAEPDYCAWDPNETYLDNTTRKLDGTSPRKMKAETVGDVLRRVDSRSKVIGISGKDRGAIFPAGHAGVAYMYMAQTGQFATSTYYMKEHPAWVKAFNGAKPADAYFGREWKPLLEDIAYVKDIPDDQKWFAKGGSLPKKIGEGSEKPDPLFYGTLLPSPFGDELTLAFARAAIDGEALGQDDATDILAVSLSSHDYINHAYSAESRMSHDHTLHLDRLLQAFFADLDAKVGKDNYLVVLTADHGFMPAPERSKLLGFDSGRINETQLVARVNAKLSQQFGEGRWVLGTSALAAILNKPLIAEKKLDFNAVAEATRNALLEEPGIAVAYTRSELEAKSRMNDPIFAQISKSWNADVSADVQTALKPYWMMASSTAVTTHGSPYPYDTQVPILFYGPKWVAPGRVDAHVEVSDIAPTLSKLLGVPVPSSAEGKPLPLPAPPR